MPTPFIDDDFLLQTATARRLYHDFAARQPILDYHNHLPPQDIAENRQFNNLFEIWLEGDHYKWRAMRANGIDESLVTGNAEPYEKFLAFARTVPHTLRNPLYHWTHLELKRYFGVEELLNETTAPAIWEKTQAALAEPNNRAAAILDRFQVRALCTTDDPTDDLRWHQQIADPKKFSFKVKAYPTFRPDKALNVHQPEDFNAWLADLEKASDISISSLSDLRNALHQRHDFFHSIGGRLSDHGLSQCFASFGSDASAAAIFDKARSGSATSAEQQAEFATHLMIFFGQLDAEKGWTKQMHIGALRNNNRRLFRQVGADIGCDSIGDLNQADALSAYLGRLDDEDALPKVVLYNLNPNDNYTFATMAGNFQDGRTAGKVQFGSGWWFLDQKQAMEWQMDALSNCGLLSRFIGMLTDSRSFMSFPRHEYFRRTLCNLLGNDIENGLVPDDDSLLQPLVENICYENARQFLGLAVGE
jgi:glucuronate isomerase